MISKTVPVRKWTVVWLGLLMLLWLAGACTAESISEAAPSDETNSADFQPALSANGSPVTAIRYSPDANLLITGHKNGALQLWDASGAPPQALNGHQAAVVDVAASPNGQLVASIGADKRTLLQPHDGATVSELETSLARANTVDFSPDGDRLAVGSWEKLGLWPVSDPDAGPSQVEDLEPSISMAYFSPDGESLLVAMSNTGLARPALLRVDPNDSHVMQTLHPDAPAHLLVASPDSQLMATAAKENVQVWCVDCDAALKSLEIAGVTAMAFGPDNETLLTLQPGVATVWDLSSNEPLFTTDVIANENAIATFAPTGDTLAIGRADGSVEIVKLAAE